MKTPLRFQFTEFDCGPISLLNAFSYLFDRQDIPVEIVKAVYKYTLDCYGEDGTLGRGGTSRKAIKKLTHWITTYANENHFNIFCERLEKEDVTYEKIKKCIDTNGCVFIRCWQENEHYVIITKIDKQYAYIFDPYYLDKLECKDKDVKIILHKPDRYNRKVALRRLLSESTKDFALGKIENRECVLINKI